MKEITAICFVLVLGVIAVQAQKSFKPTEGYVPNAETAIAIAVAVWNPIYGKRTIEQEKPFHATLSEGVWTVSGSVHEDEIGGAAEAKISKDDGRILRVIHWK